MACLFMALMLPDGMRTSRFGQVPLQVDSVSPQPVSYNPNQTQSDHGPDRCMHKQGERKA
jgi:hypothetical protein